MKAGPFICDRFNLEEYTINKWNLFPIECRAAPELEGGLYNTSFKSNLGLSVNGNNFATLNANGD